LISAGCLFWLERLAPLFFAVAIATLAYQIWLVKRRPPTLRTWGIKTILGVSLMLNAMVIASWIVFSIRYR
jgi:hypothetical protein